MSNEAPAAFDASMWNAVYQQNWENVRHIKSQRTSFTSIFSAVTAGALSLLHSGGESVPELLLIAFMCVFSLIGLLTSLRLKAELEECFIKLLAMVEGTRLKGFVALERSEGSFGRYPLRWIFPAFYLVSLVAFLTLLAYRLLVRKLI